MAYEIPVLLLTLKAGEDLSATTTQFKFVKLDANGDVVLPTAATDVPAGVLQNTPANGESASVMAIGVSKVQGDADLGIGNLIGTSADGQADAKTPGTDTTEYVVGRVLEDNSAAGGLASCYINCMNPHRAA